MPLSTAHPQSVNSEALLRQINWRYATKKVDATRKITHEDWATLERALVLAPSSYGLQPWKFFVIDDAATRAKLKGVAWNQSQITDASHLVVFAIKKDLAVADVERYVQRIAEVRKVSATTLEGFKGMMVGTLTKPGFDAKGWSARQAYLALGFFLSAAALMNIDACPMEGFDPAQFDEILGLSKQGYGSVVVATAGYRAADDAYAGLAKVRYELKDVVQHL